MSERLRIGVIGSSGYTENIHLAILSGMAEVEVAAICARSRGRVEELAAKFRVPEIYSDYRDLIRNARLDAVVIATPDDLHYPMVMAALDAGLHVLCEKPMASSAQQAAEMLAAAERAGVKHMIEFGWRWFPHYAFLRQLIHGGYVGRGYHYHLRFLGNRGRIGDYTWRFDPDRSIGVLGDLGSHMVDLALWLCSDIASVSANLAAYSMRTRPDGTTAVGANESALLSLAFADGAQGMIHVSTVAHTADRVREQTVVLHGEMGTLESVWNVFGGPEPRVVVRGARHNDERFQVLEVPDELTKGVTDYHDILAHFKAGKHLIGPRLFVDAILNDYLPEPSFHQGYRVQQILEAAIESDGTGCWVAVPNG